MNVLVHALGEHNAWWVYTYLGVELLGKALCIFGFSRQFQSAFQGGYAIYTLTSSLWVASILIYTFYRQSFHCSYSGVCAMALYCGIVLYFSLSIVHVLWPLGIFFSMKFCSSLLLFSLFLSQLSKKTGYLPFSYSVDEVLYKFWMKFLC